jgi:hypothetical protein
MRHGLCLLAFLFEVILLLRTYPDLCVLRLPRAVRGAPASRVRFAQCCSTVLPIPTLLL